MLRLRGHFLGLRGSRLDQDGLRQGQRSRAGRRRIHRLGRQLLPDAPARLLRAHRGANQVHPYRPDPEWSQRMSAPPAMLHPELLARDDPHAIIRDGRRLDHAEGASKPLRTRPEPQPRGAKIHGNQPIDQQEAAARFIAAPEHEKMHDERLWDLRQKRDREMHGIVPAVHKLRTDVAGVFSRTIGTDPENSDVHYLAEAQREATRPLILKADAGMTGCNFAVAETGTFVVCTNEGNADLSANVPKLHIASIGIEKIIPRLEHLAVFIRLLSRSALGSPMTQYTSHFRGPREGGEMHVVLVDNGRSERLGLGESWTSLKCIRCGACMNTCPVYRL